jgi:hypothetical protein
MAEFSHLAKFYPQHQEFMRFTFHVKQFNLKKIWLNVSRGTFFKKNFGRRKTEFYQK